VLPYGHRLIPVPPHPARAFIGLGGVQGHPRGPTSRLRTSCICWLR